MNWGRQEGLEAALDFSPTREYDAVQHPGNDGEEEEERVEQVREMTGGMPPSVLRAAYRRTNESLTAAISGNATIETPMLRLVYSSRRSLAAIVSAGLEPFTAGPLPPSSGRPPQARSSPG